MRLSFDGDGLLFHAVLDLLHRRRLYGLGSQLEALMDELDPVYLREQLDLAIGRFVERARALRVPEKETRWARRWLHRVDNSIESARREFDEASGIPQILAAGAQSLQEASLPGLTPADRGFRLAHVLECIRDAAQREIP